MNFLCYLFGYEEEEVTPTPQQVKRRHLLHKQLTHKSQPVKLKPVNVDMEASYISDPAIKLGTVRVSSNIPIPARKTKAIGWSSVAGSKKKQSHPNRFDVLDSQ